MASSIISGVSDEGRSPGAALQLLEELVRIESPTGSSGVERVSARIGRELEATGADLTWFPGGHLRADLAGPGDPLLLVGHSDTVWPIGTLEHMHFKIEDGWAAGPGVWDMKASLAMLLQVVARVRGSRALRVFLTADEEVSSASGRRWLEAACEDVSAAFVLEPPTEKGELKLARKGIARFDIEITGREAHAGTSSADGVSAIDTLAKAVHRLHALSDPEAGVSVNVGTVRGGTAANVVAGHASATVEVRAASKETLDIAVAGVDGALSARKGEAHIRMTGGITRPPLQPTPESCRLFDVAARVAGEHGMTLKAGATGGASDGNLVAALGVPVLDGLGPRGAGAHAAHERVDLRSLASQTDFLSALLADPTL